MKHFWYKLLIFIYHSFFEHCRKVFSVENTLLNYRTNSIDLYNITLHYIITFVLLTQER